MTTTAKPACSGCRFYQRQTASAGECRVKAPILVVLYDDLKPVRQCAFPPVTVDLWCGEFQSAPLAEVK